MFGVAGRSLGRLLSALVFGGFSLFFIGCGPTYPNCESDDHCSEKGEFCLNKVCAQCRDNSHCKGAGMECQSGQCRRRAGYCDDAVACPGSGKCRDNECGAECLANNECAAGKFCSGGSCIGRPQCGENAMKAACAEGEECQGGSCVRKAIACSSEPVYFDFDKSAVKRNQRGTLDTVAQCLVDAGANAATHQLQGYCDERGTAEYNLSLGERRAEAARRYLENKGVAADKLSTISYGEENPADPGHNERAWSKNRRVEFAPR